MYIFAAIFFFFHKLLDIIILENIWKTGFVQNIFKVFL